MSSGFKSVRRFAPLFSICTVVGFLASVSAARAVTIYDESVSGDLSSDYLNPTDLAVSLGVNDVLGVTGTPASAGTVDRDYFTFNVPAGQELVAIAVLQDKTGTAGGKYFLGVTPGKTSIDPATATGSDLLGWIHFDAFSGNVIANLGLPGGATTLGAGDYTFWVQESGAEESPYGLGLQLQTAVPETGPGFIMVSSSIIGLMFAAGRRRVCVG